MVLSVYRVLATHKIYETVLHNEVNTGDISYPFPQMLCYRSG